MKYKKIALFILPTLLFQSICYGEIPLTCKEILKNYNTTHKSYPTPKIPIQSIVEITNLQARTMKSEDIEKIIMDVALNETNHNGFSDFITNALRRTIEIHSLAESLVHLARLPYDNEATRRASNSSRAGLTATDIFGSEVSLEDFGIERKHGVSEIKNMNDLLLGLSASVAGHQAKAQFLNLMRVEEPFLELDIELDIDRISVLEIDSTNYSTAFQMSHPESNKDGLYWMYMSFLREKYLRSHVERLLLSGDLNWAVRRQIKDKYILVLASYPELVGIMDLLQQIDFDHVVQYSSHDIPLSSSYSELEIEPSLLAQVSLKKELQEKIEPDSIYPATTNFSETAYLSIDIIRKNIEDNDFTPIEEKVAETVLSSIKELWKEFSRKKGMGDVELSIGYDDTGVNFTVEGQTPKIFRLLIEFYIAITKDEKRDEYGHLFVR